MPPDSVSMRGVVFCPQIEPGFLLSRLGAGGKQTVGLLFLDVDHFKKINDTWGHAAGDVVLRQVAAAVKRTVRDSDFR